MHETTDHYDRHDNGVLTHVYYNGTRKILECIKPTVCRNYEPFEGVCLSECTWCDNPYHCKYKNVSRETFMTAHELPLFIISLDICWNCFDGIGCETSCTHDVSTEMTRIAIIMILEGVY